MKLIHPKSTLALTLGLLLNLNALGDPKGRSKGDKVARHDWIIPNRSGSFHFAGAIWVWREDLNDRYRIRPVAGTLYSGTNRRPGHGPLNKEYPGERIVSHDEMYIILVTHGEIPVKTVPNIASTYRLATDGVFRWDGRSYYFNHVGGLYQVRKANSLLDGPEDTFELGGIFTEKDFAALLKDQGQLVEHQEKPGCEFSSLGSHP